MAIKNKILGNGTLNERDNKLPPIGVKIKGVKAAIPLMPNFFQIPTAYRALFENTTGFVFLKLETHLTKNLPRDTSIITVSINPIQEEISVSYHVNPKLKPVIGPAMYFNAVASITAKYFPQAIIL
jgi:hypothetical protein